MASPLFGFRDEDGISIARTEKNNGIDGIGASGRGGGVRWGDFVSYPTVAIGVRHLQERIACSSGEVCWIAGILSCVSFCGAQETRGLKSVFRDSHGKVVGEYAGSYALLIGGSDYSAGWPDLESVPEELTSVKRLLEERGFKVRMVLDPTGEEVPARSVFIPSFVRALRGMGDYNRDGYVTGTELGMFLLRGDRAPTG